MWWRWRKRTPKTCVDSTASGALSLSIGSPCVQIHPQLREEAQESSKCKAAAHHFFHCQEKVQSGKGFKHEDCVEEM